ncbi:hypothetical protein [Actinacidiphila soli]|uniref:hypothetical protein n=1 Tax=Actinacidiphila soli TaxID=2487275 RepID=UPI0038995370
MPRTRATAAAITAPASASSPSRPVPDPPDAYRTAALAGVTASVALARTAYAFKAGAWSLSVSRHQIEQSPKVRRSCPCCHGDGGWWTGGPFPEMDACGC